MGVISNIKTKISRSINKAFNLNNDYFFEQIGNNYTSSLNYTNPTQYVEAFNNVPILPILLNKKILAFNNYELSLQNSKGVDLQQDRLIKLIANPNPLQIGKQFLAHIYAYTQVFGYAPCLKVEPFKNNVTRLYPLPVECVNIRWKSGINIISDDVEDIYDLIDAITFSSNGVTTELNKTDVYFFTDNTISFSNIFLPTSRLNACHSQIMNLKRNYEARGVFIENRGALGILSNEGLDVSGPIPLNEEEKQQLQNDYKRFGLSKSQWQVIITSLPLKWQQISMNLADLMLFENEKSDIQMIADSFGYPYKMLAIADDMTFENQQQLKKSLYQDTIIPEFDNILFQLNEVSGAMKLGKKIVGSYKHLPIFQYDIKEQASSRALNTRSVIHQFKNNLLTYNRAVEILGETEVHKSLNNKYWIDLTPEQRLLFDDIGSSINGTQ